MSIPWQWY